MDNQQKKILQMILVAVGGILALILIIKKSMGMYLNEAPLYIVLAIAGLACVIVARKIKIIKPGEDKDGLMIAGKWKCSCGAYNDKSDAFCGSCGARKPQSPA